MNLPKRKNIRLKDYDYSKDNAYFITICTHNRKNLFVGAIHESPELQLNPFGQIVDKYINQLNTRFDVKIDKYVIMPNHIHLLLHITGNFEPTQQHSPTNSQISKFIGTFKRFTNRQIGRNIWQARSYDHVIRGQADYEQIWMYIETNPARWEKDCFYYC